MLHIIAKYLAKTSVTTVYLGWIIAALYLVFVVAQLVTFETMPSIASVILPNELVPYSVLLVAVFATMEVFALPFLLGMRLSVGFRLLSALLAFCVAAGIVYIGMITAHTSFGFPYNTGLLGESIPLIGGWWLAWFGFGILVLLGWYTASVYAENSR